MSEKNVTPNRLSPREWVAVADWLGAALWANRIRTGASTADVAAMASRELNLPVTARNITGILKAEGLTLPRDAKRTATAEKLAVLEQDVAERLARLEHAVGVGALGEPPCEPQTMKLFVWQNFGPGRTPGLAVALAPDEESAREQVLLAGTPVEPSEWGGLAVADLTKPFAAIVLGGS